MNPALRCNAFRCLSLPADVELKDIYRRQNRLEIALEMGDTDSSTNGFHFLLSPTLSRETLLEAVHRLENESTRLREELFWIHGLQGKIGLNGANTDDILTSLRSQTDSNTTKGAIAQHNAAVILTCLAVESKSGKCLDYWKDALKYWTATNQNSIFWQFLEDRSPLIGNDSTTFAQLKEEVGCVLSEAIGEEIWDAIRERDFRRVASIVGAVSAHSDWLPIDEELAMLAKQISADASSRAGALIDQLGNIQKDEDKSVVRRVLADTEKAFQVLSQEIDPIFVCLGRSVSVDWPNTKATVLKKLSIAYFNHLDDNDEALRLVVEASNCATDPDLKSRLVDDWRHVQQSIMIAEALKLMESGQHAAAEQKLSGALPLATEAQKKDILDMQQACRRARVFKDVDGSKKSPTLQTINGIGATFYGQRDYDKETNSYVTTHWFTILFVPIIPLAAYRVTSTGGNSYSIYGKVPLSAFLKRYRWAVLAAIVLLIVWANINSGSTTATSNVPSSEGSTYSAPTTQESSSFSDAESSAIEAERAELKQISSNLDSQKQAIDSQAADLDQMKSYIKSVEDTYTADDTPDSVHERYKASIDDYNARLPAYRNALREYNAAVQEFERRRVAFNAKVQRYNANR
jgi:hypothetical protein